jgi:hypothetical protein
VYTRCKSKTQERYWDWCDEAGEILAIESGDHGWFHSFVEESKTNHYETLVLAWLTMKYHE